MKTAYLRNIRSILFLILVPFLGLSQSSPETSSNTQSATEKLLELVVRNNLPNFFAKVTQGGSLKVAYIGGSITAQEGWRVYSLNWFQERFPQAKFSEINAAIGGTGSDFGVFRLQEQVLRHNPDLVFIEFAVNDSRKPVEKTFRSVEGMVRQIWEHNSETDICLVYTIKNTFLEAEMAGQLPRPKIAMEKIAEHYGIPSINFGTKVSQMVKNQELLFKGKPSEIDGKQVFSRDGVHPYPETGHRIYHAALQRSFETMLQEEKSVTNRNHLPPPLTPNYFSNAHMLDLLEVALSENWKTVKVEDDPSLTKFSPYINQFGKADQTGEYISVRFKGDAIGVYDVKGPGTGRITVEIDGVVEDTISRFDAYCTYWRMSYFLIDGLKDTEHEVVFTVLAEPFDKAAILAERKKVMEDPADYQENNWYVGKILVNGTIID